MAIVFLDTPFLAIYTILHLLVLTGLLILAKNFLLVKKNYIKKNKLKRTFSEH